jgi:uncharacterized membrane protein
MIGRYFERSNRVDSTGGIVTPERKVLLVGETWTSSATHVKGFDQFTTVTQHSGAAPLLAALADSPFEIQHMAAHESATAFPLTLDELRAYDAVILSDIGANTLLLHPDVWLRGKPVPNRLKLLREWTAGGGGLVMAGGYLSFQGIDGKARWRGTAVEEALPVECLPYDDRIEVPEGFHPEITHAYHPIVRDLNLDWPMLLGANEVSARQRPGCEILARLPADQGAHPLLVAGTWGKGRSVAWMSDIGPHWAPTEFVNWHGYKTLWQNVLGWVTRSID